MLCTSASVTVAAADCELVDCDVNQRLWVLAMASIRMSLLTAHPSCDTDSKRTTSSLCKTIQSYYIGWPWGGYKNILPEMVTILPETKTRVILLASRAIYSCIPRKRAIQYYYYLYRALCVILLSYDRGWLPAAILSVYKQRVSYHRRALFRSGNNNIIAVELTILFWPPKALYE